MSIWASPTSNTSRASEHPKYPITSHDTQIPALNTQSLPMTLKYMPSDLEPTPLISTGDSGTGSLEMRPGDTPLRTGLALQGAGQHHPQPAAAPRGRRPLLPETDSSRKPQGSAAAAWLPSPQAPQGRPRVHHRPHVDSYSAAHRRRGTSLFLAPLGKLELPQGRGGADTRSRCKAATAHDGRGAPLSTWPGHLRPQASPRVKAPSIPGSLWGDVHYTSTPVTLCSQNAGGEGLALAGDTHSHPPQQIQEAG